MASIRIANCMELRLVRVWHQAVACISPSPFVLDSIQCYALIPCDTPCRFHTAINCGFICNLRFDKFGPIAQLVRATGHNQAKRGCKLACKRVSADCSASASLGDAKHKVPPRKRRSSQRSINGRGPTANKIKIQFNIWTNSSVG